MNLIKLLKQRDKLQLKLHDLNDKINNFSDGFWYAVVDTNNNYEIFQNEKTAKEQCNTLMLNHNLIEVRIISNNPDYPYMESQSEFEKYIEKLDLMETKRDFPNHWTLDHQTILDEYNNVKSPLIK